MHNEIKTDQTKYHIDLLNELMLLLLPWII